MTYAKLLMLVSSYDGMHVKSMYMDPPTLVFRARDDSIEQFQMDHSLSEGDLMKVRYCYIKKYVIDGCDCPLVVGVL